MRAFADKSKASQQTTSAKSTIPSQAHFGQSSAVGSIHHLHRTIGNHAVRQMMQAHAEGPIAGLTHTSSPRFGHDFSRIPIHASVPRTVQTTQTGSGAADGYRQEADSITDNTAGKLAAPSTDEGGKSDARGQKPPKPEAAAPKPDAKPEPAAPKPESKPKPMPEDAKKSTKPTITHETTFSAPDGTAKKRTDVGVGEEVTFMGSAPGKWTATKGAPNELANGDKFIWTAPDRAATVTIKLQVGAVQETVSMKVIEPENITGQKNSEIPIGPGTAGAGMKLTFIYHPKRVSFGNVEAREVSGEATNITGYYNKHYTAADLKHDSGDTFTSIEEDNKDSTEDTAKTVDTFEPYEKGTFDWVIPNKFKVKTEAGDGKKFTNVTQAFSMLDATGKIRITKATTAKVERSPSDP